MLNFVRQTSHKCSRLCGRRRTSAHEMSDSLGHLRANFSKIFTSTLYEGELCTALYIHSVLGTLHRWVCTLMAVGAVSMSGVAGGSGARVTVTGQGSVRERGVDFTGKMGHIERTCKAGNRLLSTPQWCTLRN
jgi:hypothetical protein